MRPEDRLQSAVELSWPAKPLWPNFRSRTHWAKTRAVKAARAEAYYATKAAKIGIPAGDVPITIQATFYPPDRRTRDYDNCGACLKAHFDGIADALGINDSAFRPERPIIADPIKGGKVIVEIGGGECDRLDTLHDIDDVRMSSRSETVTNAGDCGGGHGNQRFPPVACRSGRGA